MNPVFCVSFYLFIVGVISYRKIIVGGWFERVENRTNIFDLIYRSEDYKIIV